MPYKEFYAPFDPKNPAGWIGGWLQAWSDAGWVRTTDTGQIDPNTVPVPTAATTLGYAMYRFNDEMQATAPVFIRVEFGARGTTGTGPSLKISIGRSTNGAGVLQGILLSPTALGNVASNTSDVIVEPFLGYAASGPGWLGHFPHAETTLPSTYLRFATFLVERSRDFSGNPTADGLMVSFAGTGSGTSGGYPTVMAINYATAGFTRGTAPVSIPRDINGVALSQGTSLAAGSIGPVFPWVLFAPGLPPWQSCVAVSIPGGDHPGGLFRTTLCSVSATFRPLPITQEYQRYGVSFDANNSSTVMSTWIGLAFLWEP